MITLRTLKKKSKQAQTVLETHFPDRLIGDVFLAVRGENYHGMRIRCGHPDRDVRYGCMRCTHPLPGTPMTGAMSGYYEPEWDETTLFELLASLLHWTTKPDAMSDAEWRAALRIVGLTPASHAERMARLEQEMNDAAEGDF